MTTDRWDRIQGLFDQALTFPAGRRSGYLEKACGDDSALKAEVLSLLEHDESSPPEFLKPPDPEEIEVAAETPVAEERIGSRVGRYEIKRIIASGGMGTVFEAEQENPQRPVALKILRAGVASRYALQHFLHESRILAHLSHPNIARIYEAGTFRDPLAGNATMPYFAMEYIQNAQDIRAHVRESGLGSRECIRRFLQVCDAVHHGHVKGIIHRDLKPDNILVDENGQVKIIDFGVARVTDSDIALTTIRTSAGHIVGTLHYMSPEQCQADPVELDTRSDVYSLGVILYELLCGQLPYTFPTTSIHSAIKTICDAQPPCPSEINRNLRGDLEFIVLKAMEKNRDQRYQTAADLGRDLAHHLSGEPIEARPPTRWVRAARWVSRHPVYTTTSVCVGIALLVTIATVLSVYYMNMKPHKVVISRDHQSARLVSVSGRILHEWPEPGEQGQISSGKLITTPPEVGGRVLAIVGFGMHHLGPHRGKLCAFDVNQNLNEPIWTGEVSAGDFVPGTNRDPGEFNPGRALVIADIFPDVPGDEIVTVFSHAYALRCLRVYDLRGQVRYQAWHRGVIGTLHWMAEPRLLIAAGDTTTAWPLFGERKRPPNQKPVVLFALRPEQDVRVSEYINQDPRNPSAVWYKYLAPPGAFVLLAAGKLRLPSSRRLSGDSSVYVGLISRDYPAATGWVIDENGTMIPGTEGPTDDYRDRADFLPDAETLQFVDGAEFARMCRESPSE